MTEKEKKIVYDDEKIKERIEHMEKVLFPDTAAMLQQLMDERDAIYNDLVYLEVDISHHCQCRGKDVVDLTRSEKYEQKGDAG